MHQLQSQIKYNHIVSPPLSNCLKHPSNPVPERVDHIQKSAIALPTYHTPPWVHAAAQVHCSLYTPHVERCDS